MIRGLIRLFGRLIRLVFDLTITLALIAGCLYVYARHIEPKLLTTEEVAVTTDKISLSQPVKIVQFSDTHLGEYYTAEDLQKAVNKINALEPDIIIFTGDLIDDNKAFTDEDRTINVLKQLKGTYGKYAIYGNHDHGSNGTKRYARIMKDSGFTLLVNQHTEITLTDGSIISIIGIDDVVLSKPDMAKAFNGVPKKAYKLLLSHAPDIADEAIAYHPDLQLSGHTHGGQVTLPLIGAPFTPPYGNKYIKGMYELDDMMKLYVSSGIGTSQLPYRFFNIPEISVLTLTAG